MCALYTVKYGNYGREFGNKNGVTSLEHTIYRKHTASLTSLPDKRWLKINTVFNSILT